MMQAVILAASICTQTMQWPQVESFAPGGTYTLDCSADVDIVLVGVWQGATYVTQITSADVDAACGDQFIAIPKGLPAGDYEFRATVYSCGDCSEKRVAPKVFTVE